MKTDDNKGYDVHAPNVARHIARPLCVIEKESLIKTKFHIEQDLAPYVNCIMYGKNSHEDSHEVVTIKSDSLVSLELSQL